MRDYFTGFFYALFFIYSDPNLTHTQIHILKLTPNLTLTQTQILSLKKANKKCLTDISHFRFILFNLIFSNKQSPELGPKTAKSSGKNDNFSKQSGYSIVVKIREKRSPAKNSSEVKRLK